MPKVSGGLETIDLFYRAAMEPELWPDALGRLAEAVGCLGTALIPITPSDTITGLTVSHGLDEAAVDYRRDWWRVDTRVERIFDLKLARGVFAEAQLFSEDELAQDPIRQEFCASHGIGAFAAQLVEPWPGHVIAFSVQRSLRSGHFAADEIETLNALGQHAARALMITLKLSAAEAIVGGLFDILDRFDGGVFIINARREVMAMNARAEALLGDGISISARRPVAATSRGQKALDASISAALSADRQDGPAGAIALPRPSGKKPLLAQALPLTSERFVEQAGGLALTPDGAFLLVVDPEQKPRQPVEALRLLGLSPAEARLAAHVGSGLRRRDAADLLGVSEWTARAALKQIYSKLDIRSQAELVQLVDRIAAARRPAN
ncbi:MAG: helix-turn-helix transcriptional regulator [Rhizobiaceae bacterium]|nr:helix-turn-helix transcriptional regulator [Rhizobiaceae bacterium]